MGEGDPCLLCPFSPAGKWGKTSTVTGNERKHGVVHAARRWIDREKITAARRMRREPTEAERAAWELLRDRRCLGLKFRRQQIIDGFVVDFYCAEARLAVEIDGGVHDDPDQAEYDEQRTRVLAASGVTVARVPNESVGAAQLAKLLGPYSARLR